MPDEAKPRRINIGVPGATLAELEAVEAKLGIRVNRSAVVTEAIRQEVERLRRMLARDPVRPKL